MNQQSKRNRVTRGIAALTAAALCMLGLELFGGAASPAGAASTAITVSCDGVAGDTAGSVGGAAKSSKDLVGLLATVTHSPGGPSLDVTVDSNTPDKVKKGSGSFDATFNYSIALPTALVDAVKNTLKKNTIELTDLTVSVDYSGAQTGTLSTHIDTKSLDFTGGNPPTVIAVAGKVPTDASGRIFYRPGLFKISVKVDAEIPGTATIGTLQLACSAQGLLGSTNVQVPGAPNTPAVIDVPVIGGKTASVNLQGRSDITPDDNNPIQWDSLAIVNNPNGASLSGGVLTQPTTAAGGFLTSDVQVCAPARTIPGTTGVNDVQSLTFTSDSYAGITLNSHPTTMKLKFKGVESAAISLATPFLGNDALGTFTAPTAARLQSALEGISTIGAGNVSVTGTGVSTNPYRITFIGALAHSSQPRIEVTGWATTPFDFAGYSAISAAITAATAPAAPSTGPPDPAATDKTFTELVAQLTAGTITPDVFSAKAGNAIKNSIIGGIDKGAALKLVSDLYPQPALVAEPTVGEAPIPDASTGPLCSQFQVRTVAVPLAFFTAIFGGGTKVLACTATKTPTKVKYTARVKVNGRYRSVTKYKLVYSAKVAVKYKVRVHGKTVTKTRYVTKYFPSATQACQA